MTECIMFSFSDSMFNLLVILPFYDRSERFSFDMIVMESNDSKVI